MYVCMCILFAHEFFNGRVCVCKDVYMQCPLDLTLGSNYQLYTKHG